MFMAMNSLFSFVIYEENDCYSDIAGLHVYG